jgi:hypothetical protein
LLATIASEEIDEGLAAARKGLERLCIATRKVRPVAEMIRYVAAPDGTIVADLERKLPGRGAWVTATRAALEVVVRTNAFARAFQGQTAAAGLLERTERMLEKAALGALSLANKAGQAITGTTRIEAALAEREVAVLVHASDAAKDGVRKLNRAAAAAGKTPAAINAFRGEELDLALGRPNVVHAALLAHPASAGFLLRCQRLEHWRSGGSAT